MTRYNINDFLKEGAFLKRPDGRLFLWQGPFKAIEIDKNRYFSISYMDFFATELSSFRASESFHSISLEDLKNQLKAIFADQKPELVRDDFVNPLKDDFSKSFQSIQGKIQRGEIEKAVPITTAQAKKTLGISDLARCLFHALETKAPLYAYGFWKEGEGIIGATPEVLFLREGRSLRSMALAGTCPKSQISQRLPLLKDEKELHEHHLVVKDISERLQRLGFVTKNSTEVLELPQMFHLCTWIQVEAQNPPADIENYLVKMLHPTPALGVSPRNYGFRWLRELPAQMNRRWFGAPFVFNLSDNESLALVAIRNLQWNKDQSWVSAGCGLVSESQFEQEWQELEVKRNSVFNILGFK